MRLFQIIVAVFLLVSLFSTISGTYYFYLKSNDVLQDQVVSHLENAASLIKHHIEDSLNEHEGKIEIAATHSELTNSELREIVWQQEDFYEVFVLDSDGIVVASSDETHIGLNKSQDDYFVSVQDETYIKPAYFSETTEISSIAISTPHGDGVLVARVALEHFEDIVGDRTGLGDTGETLLAYMDQEGETVFFTERLFKGVELEEEEEGKHETIPMDEVLLGIEKVFLNTHDYRHVDVIAVTRYVDEADIGVVVKIDVEEAFGAVRKQLIATAFFIMLVLSFVVVLIGFFVSSHISRPIRTLTQEVDSITKGDFDVQLKRSNIKEVQLLTDSLSRVLASMKLAVLRTGMKKGDLVIGTKEALEAKENVEKKLEAEKEFSRAVLDVIPYGMDIIDEDLNILYMNKAFLKIFGKKAIGKKCYEVYKDNKGQCPRCPLKKPIKVGETKSLVIPGIAGGKTFKITHTGFKLSDGKKVVLEFFEKIVGEEADIQKKSSLVKTKKKSVKKKKVKSKKKLVTKKKKKKGRKK